VLDHVPTGTPAVGDVDNDDAPEIFFTSYNSMYLFEVDGTIMSGFPRAIPNANFSYQSAALADLDGDDDLEIVVGAHKDAPGCYIFHHDGSSFPGWPKYFGGWSYCPPTVADLEQDGVLEILDGWAGGFGIPGPVFYAWDTAGNIKPGFPYFMDHGGGAEGPITVADINGDGVMEVFADHNITENDQGYLFGVDVLGNDLPGFPVRTRGFTYMNGAQFADMDNDGDYEMAVLSTHDVGIDVNVYDIAETYLPSPNEWLVYHKRNRRGGLYGADSMPCPEDINGDTIVNVDDLFAVINAWGPCDDCPEDVNDDGVVNVDDLFAVINAWGPCP
jgi:hypothetical protein